MNTKSNEHQELWAKLAYAQYQERDGEVVDYEPWTLDGFPFELRGPRPDNCGVRDVAVLGAAQSFGVLVREPFTHQLAESCGVSVHNLSVGGAAPQLFLSNQPVVDRVNSSDLCIVQCMSARSTASSFFEVWAGGKNLLRPASSSLPFVPGTAAFEALFRFESPRVCRMVVEEIKRNWVEEMLRLSAAITVPKILFWFSKRVPDQNWNVSSYHRAAGMFPHFVDRSMLRAVSCGFDCLVEVSSHSGLPSALTSRHTGKPVDVLLGDNRSPRSTNVYYPSPEMHNEAFQALRPEVEKILAEGSSA